MSSIPSHQKNTPLARKVDIAALIPDFPFHYGAFLDEAKRLDKPLFELPPGGKEKKCSSSEPASLAQSLPTNCCAWG